MKENRFLILGILVGAATVYAISNVTIERKLSQLQLSLDTAIETAGAETIALAQEVGRGGLSHPAVSLIVDCTDAERTVFESGLVKLDEGLTQNELTELDRLFSRCAPTQAVRRTLMNMDLSRRVENFVGLVNQRKQIGTYKKYDTTIANLEELMALEGEITELSFDLVFLQRDIIDMLLLGERPDSEVATKLKEQGVTLRNELTAKADLAFQIRALLSQS